ncbi:MAG TPA: hypothetical protein VG819_01165 [Rhizomicrobium sp.]|nr:hypothetical protein [Rhizomicrobium sp.]
MGNIPYGKWRIVGRGCPNMVVVRLGKQEFCVPESIYRARSYSPAFEDLPWDSEVKAARGIAATA